jgi:hypothetical protein
MLHHVRVVETGWQLRQLTSGADDTAGFMLPKNELLDLAGREDQPPSGKGSSGKRGSGRTKSEQAELRKKQCALAYLNSMDGDVDLRDLFGNYRPCVLAFRESLLAHLASSYGVALDDLARIRVEHRRHTIRLSWNGLLGNFVNWATPPDPYNHLWKFLRPEQIAELQALHASDRVDRVIAMMDREGAINDTLRALVHRYFEKAATVHGVPAIIPTAAPPK